LISFSLDPLNLSDEKYMGRSNGKIFFYQAIIPHYRVPIWERLNHELNGRLVVVHGQQPKGGAQSNRDSFPFPTFRVKNYWLIDGKLLIQPFWQPFTKFGKPDVVISSQGPRSLSLFPLLMYCRTHKVPLVLRGHGGSKRRNISTSTHPVDYIHRWLVRQCDAFICYTEQSRDELAKITNVDKLFVAQNTLDTDILFSLRRKLEIHGKKGVREELSLTKSDNYMCFVGRLLKAKQVDFLLKALRIIQSEHEKVGAVIIGDGPERGNLENLARELSLKDVHFTGFLPEWELSAPYLYASDILVNPGYVGLSVNHALSFGLPVITQETGADGPFHSPEVAFIQAGATGFFFKNSDSYDLAKIVLRALRDVKKMSENCVRYAEEHLTVDGMIEGHMKAIEFVL
jgi:glycosyltransferase involved in cell wall biosynthesis